MRLELRGELDRYGVQDLLRLFFGSVRLDGDAYEVPGGPDWHWCLEANEESSRVLDLAGDARGGIAGTGSPRILLSREDSLRTLQNILTPEALSGFFRLKRDNKRLLYEALAEATGTHFPWGSLTGIRPTLVAAECAAATSSTEAAKALLVRYFGLAPHKARLALETAAEEQRLLSTLPAGTAGLYVSIPYCPSRCVYCSFSTQEGIARPDNERDSYLDALEVEMKTTASGWQQEISTLYVGGGTPGTLTANQVLRLGQLLRQYFRIRPACEWTYEAGRPDQMDREFLEAVREAGFTKLCVNPQTFHDKTLQLVQREHTVEQCLEAYALAREVGFESINMDLILGLPGEGEEEMLSSLATLEQLKPDSFTLHSLAVKRASRLKEEVRAGGDPVRVHRPDALLEAMQEEGYRVAGRLGLVPYYMYRQKDGVGGLENLGYAAPGRGNRYNLAMMGDGLTIFSFGAGAMSKLVTGSLVQRAPNVRSIAEYLKRSEEMGRRKLALLAEEKSGGQST